MTPETDDHYNDILNDAIGFDSTWNTNRYEKKKQLERENVPCLSLRSTKVVSRQIGTDELPPTKDQSSITEAAKSIGVIPQQHLYSDFPLH